MSSYAAGLRERMEVCPARTSAGPRVHFSVAQAWPSDGVSRGLWQAGRRRPRGAPVSVGRSRPLPRGNTTLTDPCSDSYEGGPNGPDNDGDGLYYAADPGAVGETSGGEIVSAVGMVVVAGR